jgi:hypothetical protein
MSRAKPDQPWGASRLETLDRMTSAKRGRDGRRNGARAQSPFAAGRFRLPGLEDLQMNFQNAHGRGDGL